MGNYSFYHRQKALIVDLSGFCLMGLVALMVLGFYVVTESVAESPSDIADQTTAKAEEQKRGYANLQRDVKAYEELMASMEGFYPTNLRETAWKRLADKYPDQSLGVEVGDTKTLLHGWATLTVKTHPPDARVRIMNINEVYRPGMRLKHGTYNIRVDAKDYSEKNISVRLEAGKTTVVEVELVRGI